MSPTAPFDEGWELIVQFAEADEFDDDSLMNADLEEPEARKTLTELLQAANGDCSVIDDYVSRCSGYLPWDSDLDLRALALEIAASLGLDDFVFSCRNESRVVIQWLVIMLFPVSMRCSMDVFMIGNGLDFRI